jgi:hypothetical protein
LARKFKKLIGVAPVRRMQESIYGPIELEGFDRTNVGLQHRGELIVAIAVAVPDTQKLWVVAIKSLFLAPLLLVRFFESHRTIAPDFDIDPAPICRPKAQIVDSIPATRPLGVAIWVHATFPMLNPPCVQEVRKRSFGVA